MRLSYATGTEEWLASLNEELAKGDTLDVIKWAYRQFGDELVYACSFGAEGMVLLDLISQVRQNATVLFLDTHLHFRETYDVIQRVRETYPSLRINVVEPKQSLAEQAAVYGDELWKRNPDLCCKLRKVEPLTEALSGARSWMSGLRREQSSTRAAIQFVNLDHKFQSLKICPLIHWSWEDVWNYIRTFSLPYNVLHDQRYPSIGCATCTLPVAGGGDSRAGRWASSAKTECGLHQA